MNAESPHCLFIIDGHSILYKAYFAIRGLSTRTGLPTNGIYGFTQMLIRVIREGGPEHLCITFDSRVPTFRKQLYPDYKANRPVMPEELQVQIPQIMKILDAMNITHISREGYEADDLIATLARMAEERGWETRVITADKDLFQIVTDKTHILRFGKKDIEEYDTKAVEARMAVPPRKIADLLGLMGDSSDNIPGVAGIGPKTASRILEDYEGIEELIKNPDRVPKVKWREKIRENAEIALLSKQLATVKTDVEMEPDFDDFRFSMKITPELEEIFGELEFKSLLGTLRNRLPDHVTRSFEYRVLRSSPEIEAFLEQVRKHRILALDTETSSVDSMLCRLVGISMSCKPNEAVYIPVGHDTDVSGGQIDLDDLRSLAAPVFLSPKIKKCGHNIKYDIKVLMRAGFELNGVEFDTMLASYLLNPDKSSHGLKAIVPEELGIPMSPITDIIGKGKSSITMNQANVKDVYEYACRDADTSLQLMKAFKPRLEEAGLDELFNRVEMPLMHVLTDMERNGIAINAGHFRSLGEQTRLQQEDLKARCYEIAGHSFNLNSPKQIAGVLFDELKLKPVKKGKSGYSTDVSVLKILSKDHPLPELLLKYRSSEKLLSTYIDTLPRQVNPETGRIHTSFIQTAAATGRLSSRDPNLQNIPVRTPEGRAIREGFVPGEKGWLFLSADYSQIELRILAHLSGDESLGKAFQEDGDVHRLTATKIFGGPEEFVTREMRDAAKTVNFGVIYGMSAHRLSGELRISRREAQNFIDSYFASYNGVKLWIEQTIREAVKRGYVTTLLGRRRYIPDLKSSNKNIKSAAERIAVNTPIQGTSADMIKKAMIAVHNRLQTSHLMARLLIQVHDELIFEAPPEEVDPLTKIVREEMIQALPLSVPVKVSVKTGRTWAEC